MSIFKDNIATARGEGHLEGHAEGHAEGRAEGRAKGRAEGVIETARNLKQLGLSLDMIAQATGLSQRELESL